ncbi:MBL fold metallo-hydrolase [Kordiimonas aquimaris]|uniref:MBL fold metallo-hydrolase n=1 Tax=Kordiimonas aquimaris TaxID=707591 RepID=UPI0021D03A44|nr:MBL fold metallo-hydrolase [Kordiimonas aquimaris]
MTVSENAVTEVTDGQTIDHRASASLVEEDGLAYPFADDVPDGAQTITIAPGILWARVPLPWSLDHINIYLFDEGDSWSVVDTGARCKDGFDAWQLIEDSVLDGKPIGRVIATHMHPDHLGLAGWLVEKWDASFWTTQAEYLLANTLWLSGLGEYPESEIQHLFKAGVDRSFEDKIRAAGYGNYKKGVHKLPEQYHRMEDGREFTLGGRQWRVVIGRGHSPEHACLQCLDEPLFISGDQVLPHITSNVSVYSREPMANPLAHWISTLDRMKEVGGNPLVLPSHGRVFFGLNERVDGIIKSHIIKLGRLHEWCMEPRTTVKTFRALYRRKIEGMEFYLALGEAIAHIHLLESLGLMERELKNDVYVFTACGTYKGNELLSDINKLSGIKMRGLNTFDT